MGRHEDMGRDEGHRAADEDGCGDVPRPVPVLPEGARGDDAELGGDGEALPLRLGGRTEGQPTSSLGYPRGINLLAAFDRGREIGWDALDRELEATFKSRPLVVGQAPSRVDRPPLWWETPTAQRWAAMIGASPFAVYAATRRVNLCEEYPGAASGGLGDAIGPPSDRTVAIVEEHVREARGPVYLLGRVVSDHFKIGSGTNAGMQRWGEVTVYWLPHPSGVSRAWNAPTTFDFVEAMVRGAVFEYQGGFATWRSR